MFMCSEFAFSVVIVSVFGLLIAETERQSTTSGKCRSESWSAQGKGSPETSAESGRDRAEF